MPYGSVPTHENFSLRFLLYAYTYQMAQTLFFM